MVLKRFASRTLSAAVAVILRHAVPSTHRSAFEEALSRLRDGERVRVKFKRIGNTHTTLTAMVDWDHVWHSAMRFTRDDTQGLWRRNEVVAAADATPSLSKAEEAKKVEQETEVEKELPVTRFPPGTNKAEEAVAKSLVQVFFSMPYASGPKNAQGSSVGTGMVVDAKKGLIVVDRAAIPSSIGDVMISIGSSLQVRVPSYLCRRGGLGVNGLTVLLGYVALVQHACRSPAVCCSSTPSTILPWSGTTLVWWETRKWRR